MAMQRREFLQAAAAGAALSSVPGFAQSPAIPSTARIEVGFAAGGTLDVIARRLADKLRGPYAENVIVESKTGAGGRIAIEATTHAAPDGGTMVLSPSSMIVIYPHIYPKLSYDPVKDLIPVTPVCSNAQAFVVSPAVPESVKTLQQFIGWAKTNKAFYGTPAAGTIMHFQGYAFAQKAGIELTQVPYRGMAAVVPDLLSGNLPTSMGVMGDLLQHLASGKLRALAVTSAQRSRFLPNVPTFAELGFPEVTGQDWYALFLPAKTPQATVDKLREAAYAAMRDKAFTDSLDQMGFDPYQLPSDELARRITAETAKWAPIVKASGFTPES